MADAPISLEALYLVARSLERAATPYAFIGGVALNVWGIPRATFDLDVAVSLAESRVSRVVSAIKA